VERVLSKVNYYSVIEAEGKKRKRIIPVNFAASERNVG